MKPYFRYRLVIGFLLIVCGLSLIHSTEVASAKDPKSGSPEDNACNPGGQMEGKCDSEWAWNCGWYMARFYSGDFTRAQVNDSCRTLLPPLFADLPSSSDNASAGSSMMMGSMSAPGIDHNNCAACH